MSSDKLWPASLETLLKWILAEERQGRIFGLRRELFFVPNKSDPFRTARYGRLLETPLGVAAGPHTQLTQNIITAWLAGARYIELKTVQILDELEVTKPCIDMTDEGYNCEWSQELKLEQSFDQYLDAWILLHVLKDKFGWSDQSEPGFIFNMSVGYNLEGILSPAVQRFLNRMQHCPQEKQERIDQLSGFYPRIKDLDIPNQISDNLTVSTMHGCPPDEIEKIGRYFTEERKLHTTIKLNPTLLGPEDVRRILNDRLGFKIQVPDLAFDHDLSYDDGLTLIRALEKSAQDSGVSFNLKLTNTLETSNQDQNLPKNEAMVYMSGRALHPISINLAAKLQEEFNGRLDLSFCAGVDCFNFAQVTACGLAPVTVCSDLLKPGGYGRLGQYLDELRNAIRSAGVGSLDEFIESPNTALANLKAYAAQVMDDQRYQKQAHPFESIKTSRPLPLFDCAAAPCVSNCPAEQDIPRYLDFTARGELDKAFRTILAANPFPNVQGRVCDRHCRLKCTRLNYDDPLLIREIKRFVAESQPGPAGLEPAPPNGLSVAVIGGGPTGLSCAYFLALEGFKVDVYETKAFAGGMAADGIPAFRLDDCSLEKDVQAVLSLGVKLNSGTSVDQARFLELKNSHNYVYLAVGAAAGADLAIPGLDAEGVYDHLKFLSAVRRGQIPTFGRRTVVIGGGNSALDAARTAKRLVKSDGETAILYRRTKNEMPADPEEIKAAIEEGIVLCELCAPERVIVEDGRVAWLALSRMELGEPDESGRPRPVKVPDSEFRIEVDTIIQAVGQKTVLDFFPHDRLEVDPETLETQVDNVFAGGDAVRGPSSLVKAIADGHRAASAIMDKAGQSPTLSIAPENDRRPDWIRLQVEQARRRPAVPVPELAPSRRLNFDLYESTLDTEAAVKEASRCLQCDIFCNVCTTVCPNRANVFVEMPPMSYLVQTAYPGKSGPIIETEDTIHLKQHFQILNLADFCNECGNCATFCPSSGAPFMDKPRVHVSRQSFENSNSGYFFAGNERLEYNNNGAITVLTANVDEFIYEDQLVQAALDKNGFQIKRVEFKNSTSGPVSLRQAAEMAILYEIGKKLPSMEDRASKIGVPS